MRTYAQRMSSGPVQRGAVGLPRWRRMFAGTKWDEPGGGRSARDWAVDAALFGFAVVMGALALGYVWHSHAAVVNGLDVAVGVLACLALWVRRSWPVVVLATIAAAPFSPLAAGAVPVAICTAAARARGRTLAAALW